MISGYLPMGAVGITDEVYRGLMTSGKPFMHGHTNTGHPVTCAVALKNIEIILEEDLVGNAARVGSSLLRKLQKLYQYPWVGEVRGLGLLAAVELVTDRQTKKRFDASTRVGDHLRSAAQGNGLIVRAIGNVIGLAPPLCLTEGESDDLVDRLDRAVQALEPLWQASRSS
jgi:4-aminobutyrate---pyruvate transaminase